MISPLVLFEDEQIVVTVKPAGVLSQKDLSGDPDMLSLLGSSRTYLGLIHRLDRPVSGVMVFAKTAEANKRLSEQMRLGKLTKHYEVVVNGMPPEKNAELIHYLIKGGNNLAKVVKEGEKDAKKAVLRYEHLASLTDPTLGELSLLKVELLTGRHHQIRVQLAEVQLPIWGDTKYNLIFNQREQGSGSKAWTQIALSACELSFFHPKSNQPMHFEWKSSSDPFSLFSAR